MISSLLEGKKVRFSFRKYTGIKTYTLSPQGEGKLVDMFSGGTKYEVYIMCVVQQNNRLYSVHLEDVEIIE